MAVTPITLSRISFNQRTQNLLESLRSVQVSLYGVQNQIATGQQFSQPSEAPTKAATLLEFHRRLDRLGAVQSNLRDANAALTEAESAASDAADIMIEIRRLATETVGDSTSPDERKALAEVASSLLDRMVAVGNRQHRGAFLFSGQRMTTAPFEMTMGGVVYHGDDAERETINDTDLSQGPYTVSGEALFGATSASVQGDVDLDPILTVDTRISDLRGTTGRGVSLGSVRIVNGATSTVVDLSDAATVGDIVDRLAASLPASAAPVIGATGIRIDFAGAAQFEVQDLGGGTTARDLGLDGGFDSGAPRSEPDLDAKLAAHMPITTLRAGAGLALNDSLRITNGANSATISMAGAATLEDVLNRINQANVGVRARISNDGRTVELVNRVSGIDLSVSDTLGSIANQLGIRSMRSTTPLATLNDGLGVGTVGGNDLRITTRNGTAIDVDLDGLTTLQDVIDRLNSLGGGAITASLATGSNGLMITDNTAGGGTFSLTKLNESPALDDLGLNVTAVGGLLVGRDVNPVRVDGVFTGMLELRNSLTTDDRRLINIAGQRLERVMEAMQLAQGRLASRARELSDRASRVENEFSVVQVLQSDLQGTDLAEAAVKFQQLQTALQANLQTANRVLNLSLFDYLK